MPNLMERMEAIVRRDRNEEMKPKGQFKAITTSKPAGYEFNEVEVYGDLIHSGNKVYIHPVANSVKVSNEIGKLILMHEVKPETVERLY